MGSEFFAALCFGLSQDYLQQDFFITRQLGGSVLVAAMESPEKFAPISHLRKGAFPKKGSLSIYPEYNEYKVFGRSPIDAKVLRSKTFASILVW
ncbi:MAG: hypothetical protein DRR19_10185 [Candidatus Parabeggiatoa sp. nov. 1]|nr:MAG: hypothetical protein DRR19_10185 [Gammaproteobacteria bacterium]